MKLLLSVPLPCCLSLILVTGCLGVGKPGITLKQSRESGVYQRGESVQVIAYLSGSSSDSLLVTTLKNNQDESQRKISPSGDSVIVFDQVLNESVSLIFEVQNEDGAASLGLVVDPEGFEPGTERPADLDRYWEEEKRALRNLPVEVNLTPVTINRWGYTCSDVELNCTGPKPARGYFAKPKIAEAGTLPIVLFLHAAGVNGDWCLAQPERALQYARMGHGTLAFDLNAHGMRNGQPAAYYDSLDEGPLKHYYRQGIESKQDFYFRGMYLRILRTLDFLTRQPEWDGKRILVIGESQGGGQALAAAGLDSRVTAVVATVPAMCDWGGSLVGRGDGWPKPLNFEDDPREMLEVIPYFDVAHLLTNSQATLVTEIGFIDRTCPATSIYAAINQAAGKKIILEAPYRGHHLDQKIYQDIWENKVQEPKLAFIEEYLK